MNIVFVGASRFGLRCLSMIMQLDHIKVSGIITNEQQFTISYAPEGVKNVLYANFKEYATAHGVPCYVMQSKMTDPTLLDQIKEWKPDLIVVVGWYHMVPKSLLDAVPVAGLHASLLPDYSGGAPLVWAIINGEQQTGITFFQFAEGVDNGPVFAQTSTRILPEDTIATLYIRIEMLGINLLKEFLPRIANGTVVPKPQDESKRRIFPQRKPEDGRIDWSKSAKANHDFIRAQTHPYPGAFTQYNGQKLYIWESKMSLSKYQPNKPPGFVYKTPDNQLRIVCGGKTSLEIITVGVNDEDIPAIDWFLNSEMQYEDIFVCY